MGKLNCIVVWKLNGGKKHHNIQNQKEWDTKKWSHASHENVWTEKAIYAGSLSATASAGVWEGTWRLQNRVYHRKFIHLHHELPHPWRSSRQNLTEITKVYKHTFINVYGCPQMHGNHTSRGIYLAHSNCVTRNSAL